ncbi:hypothetical protein EVAR_11936_1 [Eumeta japonica]|uniref:Uncharacterized protein n=1 Tax=Eumeta variegata TaxID=151549 RepID=A0A4C1U503_EUMVA|nr:hypothetical protein EVAR_11936_1 [Eumeta japonica]
MTIAGTSDLIKNGWVDGSAPRGSRLTRESIELPTIAKYMKDVSKRFFDIAKSHPNALLRSVASYEAQPYYLICRPRNVLIDPSDALIAKVQSLMEVNDAHDFSKSPHSSGPLPCTVGYTGSARADA